MSESPPPDDASLPRLDARDRRILDRLNRLIGRGAATFFSDALLLQQKTLRLGANRHLIAHLARELHSMILDVLVPGDPDRARPLRRALARLDRALRDGAGSNLQEIAEEIRRCAELAVPNLATRPIPSSHANRLKAALERLGIDANSPLGEAWLAFAAARLARDAHRQALDPARPIDVSFELEWGRLRFALDGVLAALEARYPELLRAVDDLTRGPPTKAAAKKLRNEIPNVAVLRERFFSRIGPAWLGPLEAAGLFEQPIIDPADSEYRWWQSEYLKRMAATPEVQSRVGAILARLGPSESARLQVDLIDAAAALPAEHAAAFAVSLATWIDGGRVLPGWVADKIAAVVVRLATGAEPERARQLARALLSLAPDHQGRAMRLLFDARPLCDDGSYRDCVRTCQRPLLEADPRAAMTLGIHLLVDAIGEGRTAPNGTPQDYSRDWCERLDDDALNEHDDLVARSLVVLTRDAAVAAVERDAGSLSGVLDELEQAKWPILRRIALHVLTALKPFRSDLARARILDRSTLSHPTLQREQRQLLRCTWPHLNPEERADLLGWIDDGPPDREGEPKRAWQWRLLAVLATDLPEPWEGRYQALVAEFGEPQSAPLRPVIESWVGPTSPWTAEVIREWTVRELVDALASWTFTPGWAEPAPEGAARVLTEVVAGAPAEYARHALLFRDLEPTYVRALLDGLTSAITADHPFEWPAVLALCRWASAVPDPPSDVPDPGEGDRDPHWGWARRSIAALFQKALGETSASVPIEHRQEVWEILRPLTDDPEPTPSFEASYGGENMDPLTLSINTTRGEAMHAVMHYCLWVGRAAGIDDEGGTWPGLAALPEVRPILEQHLDIARDPSPSTRAVYGRWLPYLVRIDAAWVRAHSPALFPRESELTVYRDAAWDAYITLNPLWKSAFEVLEEEYAESARRAGHARPSRSAGREPGERLAEHVTLAYLRGWVDLGAGGLVATLFAAAPIPVRVRALDLVGRLFDKAPDAAAFAARAQQLWDWRAGQGPAPDELAAFGWWYGTGTFDEAWALPRLTDVLRRCGRVEMDDDVAERLAASDAPLADRLAAADLLVDGVPAHGWEIASWQASLTTLLTAGLAASGTEDQARAMVGRLSAKGFPAYADLLRHG